MMSSTVDLSILVEIDEVNKYLFAYTTHETGRMPWNVGPSSWCKDDQLVQHQLRVTLLPKKRKDVNYEINYVN